MHDADAITSQQAKLIQKILQLSNTGIHNTAISRYEADQIISIAGVLVEQYVSWLSWGFDDEWKQNL
ncbi:MAG: hypothetical protein AAF152_13385 [Cyanobacteria bacterium P01_A01_bin.114]